MSSIRKLYRRAGVCFWHALGSFSARSKESAESLVATIAGDPCECRTDCRRRKWPGPMSRCRPCWAREFGRLCQLMMQKAFAGSAKGDFMGNLDELQSNAADLSWGTADLVHRVESGDDVVLRRDALVEQHEKALRLLKSLAAWANPKQS